AEWIVEAPARCDQRACVRTPLAPFGSVAFEDAELSAGGSPVSLADPGYNVTPIQLLIGRRCGVARGAAPPVPGARAARGVRASLAPGPISQTARAFAIVWTDRSGGTSSCPPRTT